MRTGEHFKKKVYCSFLDMETNVQYRISNLNAKHCGRIKKSMDHCACDLKPICEGVNELRSLASFLGIERTGAEALTV
jgi:hypothetical protein